MTPEKLQIHLSEKFDLLLFMDLANLLKQHRTAFDVFKSIHRPVFDPNHRLVFYTSHEPTQDIIDHIQRAAVRSKIGNFFVLIVCPYDVEKKLSLAFAQTGHAGIPMQSLIIPIVDSLPMDQSKIVKTTTLCPLPFVMSHADPHGSVAPCCKFKGSIGDYTVKNLTEIFFGDAANRIRQKMMQGKSLPECVVCWDAENSGTKSLRSHAMDKYGQALDQGWLDDVQIRDVTWSPSTICNFKCRICSSNNSSSMAVEDIMFSVDQQRKTELSIALKKSLEAHPSIKDQIVDCEHLEYLHIMGGEPLLWPDFGSLINDLILNGTSRNIHLELNSNGSVYDDVLMHKIIQNFASLEILLSIDNIGERFEIERGGTWYEVRHNIERFAALNGGCTKIKLVPTINIQNVLYLDDVCDLAADLNLGIVWWYLEAPACLCIDYVTEAAKNLIVDKYQDSPIDELQKIVRRLQQAPMSDGKSFGEYVKKFDTRRDQNFQNTHREIFEAMCGC